MEQQIIFVTLQISDGPDIYRTFTSDFIKFSDPTELGETIQDMMESLETKAEGVFDAK